MTKATQTFTTLGGAALIYIVALFQLVPFHLPLAIQQEILPVLPFWALVTFGSYALWTLGWGIFTFQDKPEAYQELLQQINDAKNDLRDKGVTVD